MNYRCFSPGLYPAMVRNQMIIFDISNDKFHMLSGEMSNKLKHIYCYQLDEPIHCGGKPVFTPACLPYDKYDLLHVRPVVGVSVNFWHIPSTAISFQRYRDVAYLFWCLHRVHGWIKKGVGNALEHMNNLHTKTRFSQQDKSKNVHAIILALNAASLIYPRKTQCLAWSMALIYALLPLGAPVTLRIGVQNHPFYSHAWVEREGKVMGDESTLPEKMVTIFSRTWGEHV